MLEFRRDARRALEAVRRGERLILTYRGRAIARLEPVREAAAAAPGDDPLLRLDEYAVDGPRGKLTNNEIDRLLYGG
jgi:antitoxin (DNA-binding transcriptional repressor) of toxin-antitoxin stability system